MNPELADRLRRFGDTVDRAAVAAQADRAAGAPPRPFAPDPDLDVDLDLDLDELPSVVPIAAGRRSRRFRSITAAAAAAVVVAAGAMVTAVVTGNSDPRPASSTEVSVVTTAGSTTTTTPSAPTTVPVAPPVPGNDASTTSNSPTTTSTSSTSTTAAPAAPATPLLCPDGYDPYPARYPIRACQEGPAVVLIQQHTGAPEVDGLFGPATRQSVRAFQELHGLNADGLVGPLTWAAMFPAGAPGVDADGNGTVEPWEVG